MMKATDKWMPLWINDFVGGTQALDAEGVGCYLLLLMYSWTNGPLPTDEKKAMRIARLYRESQAVTLQEVLSDHWKLTPEGYINERLEIERALAETRSASAAGNARKRWEKTDHSNAMAMRPHSGGNAGDDAESMRNGCSSPSPSPSHKKTKTNTKEATIAAVEARSLHKSIEMAFLSKAGRFTDYGKEGRAIQGLIKKFEDLNPENPEMVANQVISKFFELRNGDKFFGGQPFTPSALNASGIFDRVMVRFEDHAAQVDPEVAGYYQEQSV